MLLHVLRHIDPGHHVIVVEEILGKSLGKLGLADTGCAEEDKAADGAARVVESCARAAHCITDRADGVLLADNALMEFLLEVKQFIFLALSHFLYGDPGPAAHHFGDILRIDLLLDHGAFALQFLEPGLYLHILALLLFYSGVTDLGHFGIVAFALGAVSLYAELLDVDLVLLDSVDLGLLRLPFRAERLFRIAEIGEFFVDFLEFVRVVLSLDGLTFDFQLFDFAGRLVKSLRL